jgi:glycosyltransferase involved in cell wall biosynthesis
VPTVALDARDAFSPQLRGWGRYAQRLVQAIRDAPPGDLDVLVVERGGRGPEVAFEQVGLPRLLRRRGAAAVHAPNCFLPLRRPCPGVVTVHDLAFEEFPGDFAPRTRVKYRHLARRAVRGAERVIVDAEFTRGDLERRWGVDPARVRVVPLAAALPPGDEDPPPGPYLLAVGDLREKKNLGRLVEAYARLRAQGMEQRLVLAGLDTGEGERVRALAGDAPVELAGYVSDARLDALLRGADLLVHPSLYEGFGFVVLEAMERGCPVAVSDATCLPETAGPAAELFDARDTEAIAAAITAVVDDPERHAELVASGRRHAASYDWARTARQTLDVYRELL